MNIKIEFRYLNQSWHQVSHWAEGLNFYFKPSFYSFHNSDPKSYTWTSPPNSEYLNYSRQQVSS